MTDRPTPDDESIVPDEGDVLDEDDLLDALEALEPLGEVALLGDGEPIDEVDEEEERRAPGEPPPGIPVEEQLSLRPIVAEEPVAEVLELVEEALELPVPDEEELPRDEEAEAEERELDLEEDLGRGAPSPSGIEVVYEELDALEE